MQLIMNQTPLLRCVWRSFQDTEPTTCNVIPHGYLRIPQDFILLQLFISKEERVELEYVSKTYLTCHMEAVSALMQAS